MLCRYTSPYIPPMVSRIAFIAYLNGMKSYILRNISGSTSTGYVPPEPPTCKTITITEIAMPMLSSAKTSA